MQNGQPFQQLQEQDDAGAGAAVEMQPMSASASTEAAVDPITALNTFPAQGFKQLGQAELALINSVSAENDKTAQELLGKGLKDSNINKFTKSTRMQEFSYGKMFFVGLTILASVVSIIGIIWLARHMKRIDKGQIGVMDDNGQPRAMDEGWHFWFSPMKSFDKACNITDETIDFGKPAAFRLVTVKAGALGVTLKNGQPVLLPPGRHLLDRPDHTHEKNVPTNVLQGNQSARFSLGDARALLKVDTANVGYCYIEGNLQILQPGWYLVDTARVELLDNPTISLANQKVSFKVENIQTADKCDITISGDLLYKITDPERYINLVQDKGEKYLKDLVENAYNQVIPEFNRDGTQPLRTDAVAANSDRLEDDAEAQTVAQASTSAASIEPQHDGGTSSGASSSSTKKARLYKKGLHAARHNAAIDELYDQLQEFGIQLFNLGLDGNHLTNKDLANQLSQQAVAEAKAKAIITTRKAETEGAKLDADKDRARAAGRADATESEAKGQAKAMELMAAAEATKIRALAEAEAAATQLRVNAETDALKRQAQELEKHPLAQKILELQLSVKGLQGATVTVLPESVAAFMPFFAAARNTNMAETQLPPPSPTATAAASPTATGSVTVNA